MQEKQKEITYGPRDVVNVSWALFLFSSSPWDAFGPCVPIPHSSLPPFRCPSSSAASTHNPPHEQWLAGLGVGAGLFLLLGLLAHSCSGGWGVPIVVAPSPRHYCSPFHPASSCSQRWLLSHPCCSSSHYPPCEWWWQRWGLKRVAWVCCLGMVSL
jgi:hypothetical protein